MIPTIRRFNRNDLRGVLDIEKRCFAEPWLPNMFEALFQIYPDGFYVAVIDEYIVGYVVVLIEQSSRLSSNKRAAHIMNLAVHPRFRNLGIGRKLIDTIISTVRRAGEKEIYLEVRASNNIAIAFYTELEFKRVGLIKRFYNDEDAVVMVKEML